MDFPYNLVCLTHSLHSGIPTWPGSCGFHHNIHIDYEDCPGEDKFRVMKISNMHSGIGTHMDAPSHCIPGGRNIDSFSIQELFMPAIVLDVSSKAFDERYQISVQDILDFENIHGTIPQKSCVFCFTGWDRYWDFPEKYHNKHVFPTLSKEGAQLLFERNISVLGIDTLSIDFAENGFPIHRLFLGANKILIENVTNLNKVPPIGSYILISPLKIQDGTEAPIGLTAFIKK